MSWHKGAGGTAGLVAIALAIAIAAAPAGPAWGAPPLRLVVLVDDALDEKVLVRIRGHASDLPVIFVPARGSAAQIASQAEQLASAEALAARGNGDAVIWFSYGRCSDGPTSAGHPPDWLIVHVAQPRTHSILTRWTGQQPCPTTAPSGGAPATTTPESAVLEGAAIVVRTALVALLEGATIGVTPPRARAEATFQPRIGINWVAAADGLSPWGQQGPQGRLGFGRPTWGAELAAAVTVPAGVTDENATLFLSRATATIGAMVHHPLGSSWLLTGSLHGGVAALTRRTVARKPDVQALPPGQHLLLIVVPEARLGWAIPWIRELAAVFALGADFIPAVPVIEFVRQGPGGNVQSTTRRRPWPVQPRASIGIELRLQ